MLGKGNTVKGKPSEAGRKEITGRRHKILKTKILNFNFFLTKNKNYGTGIES